MSNCRQGEKCNGTRHVQDGGVYKRCTCYFYQNQIRYFEAGGIPTSFLKMTLAEALRESGRDLVPFAVDPREAAELARELAKTPRIVMIRSRGRDTFPFAAWLMAFVACYIPVRVLSLQDIVADQFLDKGGDRLLRAAKNRTSGLIIRFGRDRQHSYNADTLVDVLQTRKDFGSATVLAEAPAAGNPKFIYGSALDWIDQNARIV